MALDIGVFLDSVKNLFKAKVSSNDTQPDYLINKFTSSDASVTITETNDGGVEQINLQSSGGGGGGGNFADTDLTFDADRIHELTGYNMTINDSSSSGTTGAKIEHTWDSFGSGLSAIDIFSWKDQSSSTGIFVQKGTNWGIKADERWQLYNSGGSGVLRLYQGAGASYTRIEANDDSYHLSNFSFGTVTAGARVRVKGSGSTSSTTALLVENSSGTDLLEIKDDGTFELKNGTYTNFYAEGSTNRLSIGMGATTDSSAHLTIRNASSRANGLLLQDSSGNDMAWLGGAFTVFYHGAANDDYHLFTNSAGVTKLEQYHNTTNIMAFRSNGTSFMTGNFSVGANVTASATLDVHGHIAIDDGVTAPSSTSGKAKLYVDSADGDLKVIFGDGTVKTIVTDS